MHTAEQLSVEAERVVIEPIAEVIGKVMAAQAEGKDIISLAAGLPDPAMLPTQLMPQLVAEAEQKHPGYLNYTRPQGWPPLNIAFAHMLSGQGVQTTPDNILITSGGMEALSLAAQLVVNEGDTVVMESPAFPGAINTLRDLRGANIIHVRCDEQGMVPEALRAAIKAHHPRFLSIMPDGNNPSGTTMPLERRKEIAALLKEFGIFAVEDGAYSQLYFGEEPLPPLQSLAPDNVMYETSVSKILAPAMRIGALVVPSGLLLGRATGLKANYNMQASAFTQAITERFISPENSYLADNLARLREAYRNRRDLMIAALGKHFPEGSGYSWNHPSGGMFIWFTGPEKINFYKLLDKAIKNGVAYVPGNMFYAEDGHALNTARLNFASIPEDRIEEAIGRLAKTLA